MLVHVRVFVRLLCAMGLLVLGVAVLGAATARAQRTSAPALRQRLQQFWQAGSLSAAEAAGREVASAGASFDEVYAALKQGRTYAADVPTGVVRESRRAGSLEFAYTLDVPASYDPTRSHPVRVQLHGGVMRPEGTPRGDGSIGALRGAADQIYVIPNSWRDAPWWSEVQLENLSAILDSVKRRYNVDENRVALSGVSDGATAAYYVAMRETTPYASFLPLNGFIIVLRNRDVGIRDALYPHNLINKPFFVVNGGQDPLYPASRVTPYMDHFRTAGLDLTYRPQAEGGHNTAWWPTLKDEYEAFVSGHPRQPHPDRLSWETDDASRHNRAHWLVIDKLSPTGGATMSAAAAAWPDLNDFTSGMTLNFGIRTSGSRVTAVLPGSNAEKFGLKAEDTFVSINGQAVPRGLDPLELLSINNPGTPITIVVSRESDPVELSGTYEPVPTKRIRPIFEQAKTGGRVDVTRQGNTITATSRGVDAFRLLLSPDVVDFSRPVTVVLNGQRAFEGPVHKSVETLLRWAARDNDRSMLYAAELAITVPR